MEHRPVVHDGRVFCLWHAETRSAIFDPASNAWTPLADPFGRTGAVRGGAVVASTGAELIVWGGAARSSFGSRDFKLKDDGVRLGADGTWRVMATPRAPSQRGSAVHAWTGRELIVWGGWKQGKPVKGGAAYDPATDTWRRMAPRETLADRTDSVWSERQELWCWDHHDEKRTGHAYDPREDRWRDLATLPEKRLHHRAMVPCLGGALLVCREGHFGSDIDGCAVWRYEPDADLWEPSAPPPVVRGGEPRLVDCDGRIVLGIAESLFEYLPARDAWAELPRPELGSGPELAWVGGRLYAFGKSGPRALELPASSTPLAPPEAPIVVAAPASPVAVWPTGPAVTALVFADRQVIAGHEDGRVTRDGEELRKADGRRIAGLAARDGGFTCLVGDRLETRGAGGKGKVAVVELGAVGHALAHDGDALVVAAEGALRSLAWSGSWSLARRVDIAGTTIHLALLGDTIARVIAGPEKRKGERKEPRDTVELRDAGSLALREEITPRFASGSAAAVPVPGGTLVAGLGSYRTEHYPRGKKRATTALHDSGFSRIATSRDGQWLLAAHRSVGFYDLRRGEREIFFEEERSREPLGAIALDEDATVIAFGTSDGAVYVIDRERLGITVYLPDGSRVVLQPPRSEVVSRGTPRDPTDPTASAVAVPEGQRGIHGWRRWHVRASDGERPRFLELPEQVAELAVLPDGGLVARARASVLVMDREGRPRATFAGHGGELTGLSVAPDGRAVTVWDRPGIVRRWHLAEG